GYSPDEMIGKTLFEFMPPYEAEKIGEAFNKIVAQKKPITNLENWNISKEGRRVCLLTNGVPFLNENGWLLGFRGVDRDITELKHAEEVLKRSEEKFAKAFHHGPLLMAISSIEDGNYQEVNENFVRVTGYSKEESIGTTSVDLGFISEEDRDRLKQELMQNGRVDGIEMKLYKKGGDTLYCQYFGEIIMVAGEQKLLSIASDISDRRQTEEALRESEAHLRTLIETIPDLVWLKDPDGVYISCNPKFERFFGAKEADIRGKTDYDFVDKELADFFREKDKAAMAAAIPVVNEEEVTYADDGHKELLETIKTPMYDSEGKLVGVLGIARDITERKHAENFMRDLSQMLMQAQERERQMISCELHDSIAQDLSTLKLYCNRLFEKQSSPESDIKGLPEDVSTLIDQTITSVRDLAYDLRPPSLDHLGLVYALKVFCEEFTEKNNIMIDFQVAGIHESTLNSDTQINLYRLVTEGLNNVRKHAVASKAMIRLVGASPNIILRIEDNGKGFDVKERERLIGNEKRMGLRSMKERVNLLQGQMSIHSQLNKGTKIIIKLPL
ncbi:MAG: PAS domain S-box protein, partial [Desulfobacula sp.]|uniref:sensor histidine kinase n=1 Tax=Desulfobacula sp. TaxID=2593537 RepID=UPI0025C087BE